MIDKKKKNTKKDLTNMGANYKIIAHKDIEEILFTH